MDHALFYIAGGALIVVALLISLFGMRSDNFPSSRVLQGGVLVIVLLVAATAWGAIQIGQDEQSERRDEANREAAVEADQQDVTDQDTGDTESPTPANQGAGPKEAVDKGAEKGGGSGLDGSAVFVDTGCGSCHSLAELGSQAQGTIGPNLDEALVGKDEKFIQTSIEDPSAFVAEGFPDGTMPQDYKQQLTPAQITALVTYLSKATGS
jgi:mono/diheme cytochrome c family protein